MGFKVESSFLRFLTMGALASRHVMKLMTQAGLDPVELERYSSSNKIWATKVKRLRLPDLLCVKTGLRIEVRAKSDLAIRMSDAPGNPDRRWFSGVHEDDLIAFVPCQEINGVLTPSEQAHFFLVADILSCPEEKTKLGPPKSASEGSERNRVWGTIVPKQSGEVAEIDASRIVTRLSNGRKQTYRLRGLTPYVSVGSSFVGGEEFLAGLPCRKVRLSDFRDRQWNPADLLQGNRIDKYVFAKAMSKRGAEADFAALSVLMEDESDKRVALEAAGSLAKHGYRSGLDRLVNEIHQPTEGYLRMEAAFILAELVETPIEREAVEALTAIARDDTLIGNEVRQAAIWGLGQAGLRADDKLLDFLGTTNEDERLHAVVAFSPSPGARVVERLHALLISEAATQTEKSSAAYVLSKLEGAAQDRAVELLRESSVSEDAGGAWSRSVLGSLPDQAIRTAVGEGMFQQLMPIRLLTPAQNWTKTETALSSLTTLSRQVMPTPG